MADHEKRRRPPIGPKSEKWTDMQDALDVINSHLPSDGLMIRQTGMAFPTKTTDQVIAMAVMDWMSKNLAAPGPTFQPDVMEPGEYEITVAVHMRRTKNWEDVCH